MRNNKNSKKLNILNKLIQKLKQNKKKKFKKSLQQELYSVNFIIIL